MQHRAAIYCIRDDLKGAVVPENNLSTVVDDVDAPLDHDFGAMALLCL